VKRQFVVTKTHLGPDLMKLVLTPKLNPGDVAVGGLEYRVDDKTAEAFEDGATVEASFASIKPVKA